MGYGLGWIQSSIVDVKRRLRAEAESSRDITNRGGRIRVEHNIRRPGIGCPDCCEHHAHWSLLSRSGFRLAVTPVWSTGVTTPRWPGCGVGGLSRR
jgi:hypothetical protein